MQRRSGTAVWGRGGRRGRWGPKRLRTPGPSLVLARPRRRPLHLFLFLPSSLFTQQHHQTTNTPDKAGVFLSIRRPVPKSMAVVCVQDSKAIVLSVPCSTRLDSTEHSMTPERTVLWLPRVVLQVPGRSRSTGAKRVTDRHGASSASWTA